MLNVTVKKLRQLDSENLDGAQLEIEMTTCVEFPHHPCFSRGCHTITAHENRPLLVRDFIEFLKLADNVRVDFVDGTNPKGHPASGGGGLIEPFGNRSLRREIGDESPCRK